MEKILIAFVILAATLFAACNSGSTSETKKNTAAGTVNSRYIKNDKRSRNTLVLCIPEVISDTPGHCPKCEMHWYR
jgi:hypothetical protein